MTHKKYRSSLRYRAMRLLTWPLNVAMAGLDVFLAFPLVGRAVKWLLNTVMYLIHFVAGMYEYAMMKAGFMGEKKLQLGVVILRDENNQPLTTPDKFVRHIQETIDIFYEAAKVRVVPVGPTPYEVDENGHAIAGEHWIQTNPAASPSAMLDVHCNTRAVWEDFWLTGTLYQYLHARRFMKSSLRRLTGYGAPVLAIVVREIHKHGGCSLGPFSDYITLAYNVPACLAHELGHACNLLHKTDPEERSNLMFPKCGSRELTEWQVAALRASRHVTYF